MEKNKIKLTWLAFMMVSFIGTAFILQGTVKINMAEFYGVTTSKIQYIFTIFIFVNALVVALNKYVEKYLSIKNEIVLASLIAIIGSIIIYFSSNLQMLSVGLIIQAVATGVFASFINYIIINLYEEERSKKLNLLHFFYAFASIIMPLLATYLLEKAFSWQILYLLILTLIVVIVYLALTSDFHPLIHENDGDSKNKDLAAVDLKIILAMSSIFAYVFSEMNFTYWIVELMNNKGVDANRAKIFLSLFWITIAVGRFFAPVILRYIKSINLLLIMNLLAFIPIIFIMTTNNYYFAFVLVLLSGLGYSAQYATIMDIGTSGRKKVSQSVINLIVMAGTVGGILFSPISSYISSIIGINGTMISGIVMMILVLLMTLYIKLKYQKN